MVLPGVVAGGATVKGYVLNRVVRSQRFTSDRAGKVVEIKEGDVKRAEHKEVLSIEVLVAGFTHSYTANERERERERDGAD